MNNVSGYINENNKALDRFNMNSVLSLHDNKKTLDEIDDKIANDYMADQRKEAGNDE